MSKHEELITSLRRSLASLEDGVPFEPGTDNPVWGVIEEMRATLARFHLQPLYATFRPQEWQGDYAVDVAGAVQFDATAKFLSLPLDRIQSFLENNYDSDDLASELPERQEHGGPFEVDTDIDAWLEANGLEERESLTQEQLDMLRERYGVTPRYANVWVDVPNHLVVGNDDDHAWKNVGNFHTKAEAVRWIRENIGPCDDDGNIGLITLGGRVEEGEVSHA